MIEKLPSSQKIRYYFKGSCFPQSIQFNSKYLFIKTCIAVKNWIAHGNLKYVKKMLSDAWFRDLKIRILRSRNQIRGNYFFLENYVTSERAVSHNVLYLYFHPLPITHYQGRFYAKSYVEYIPIVSTAFNTCTSSARIIIIMNCCFSMNLYKGSLVLYDILLAQHLAFDNESLLVP